MRDRIMDILLACSPYDAFLLEEAGQLSERVLGEFRNLDLHYGPGLTGVTSGADVLALAREQSRFNLIVTALQLRDMNAQELAEQVRAAGLGCGRRPRLRQPRAEGLRRPPRRLRPRPRVPLAGRRPHPARDRQIRRGPPERRP
jgi:CheY-like chemotaxis protein